MPLSEPPLAFHSVPGRGRIAYRHRPGRTPTVVYLGGYQSAMSGHKAVTVDQFCGKHGLACLRFDYTGHGESEEVPDPGELLGGWRQEVADILTHLAEPPLVLVGSSMGAWLMLLATLDDPAEIRGLIGIAAAPDFTEDLVWRNLPRGAHRQLLVSGAVHVPTDFTDTPYRISRDMIREARSHLLLRETIPLRQPLRLLHGMADDVIPWTTAVTLAERYAGDDVALHLIKGGDHRLSDEIGLAALEQALGELLRLS